jgi:PPOX class probable FMN-dependent enzyme
MGTMGPDGLGDVTPRGGERGFVHVLDERTLAMPDRPGNNRLDSLTNLTSNPGVGLLFFVAGFEDLLRVNGRARISRDSALMDRFVVDGRPPRSVVIVDVAEVYLHCPKAIRRAGLWRPETWVDRSDYPTAGQVYRDQLSLDRDVAAIDAALDRDARENLY